MASHDEILNFIRSTFRSVWTLELLLFLIEHKERSWSHAELVSALRGSDLVVTQGLDSLVAAGLVTVDAKGSAQFVPASAELERQADDSRRLYAKSPDAVRRAIISATSGSLTAFADAFRLRKD